MNSEEFLLIAEDEFARVPDKFRDRIKNLILAVDDCPDDELRRQEGLAEEETLLGFYKGIPMSERGHFYGVGETMPDTIILFRLPILEAAEAEGKEVREVIKDTLWHEIAHYFGFKENEVHEREHDGTNRFS